MILSFDDIKRILPHGFPFLFVDRVQFLDVGKRIIALKNISGNEWCFLGHFPEKAIFPGVLLIEAIAQTAGILLFGKKRHPGTEVTLAHSDIRFLHPVVPGDQLVIEVNAIKVMRTGAFVRSEVTAAGVTVAKGKLTLKIGNQKNKNEPDVNEY
jgi:3-hydroxyacyl-[acyl-carrier-protein] dehydratase